MNYKCKFLNELKECSTLDDIYMIFINYHVFDFQCMKFYVEELNIKVGELYDLFGIV